MRMFRGILPMSVAAGCLLLSCGQKPPTQYVHDGSLKFTIDVPVVAEARPEKSDGAWTSVSINNMDAGVDVLVNWQSGWSYEQLLQWFNGVQAKFGDVMVFTKEDLPGGRGVFVHYMRNEVEYAKSVVRCGDQALQCMATMQGSLEPGALKEQIIAACRSIECK